MKLPVFSLVVIDKILIAPERVSSIYFIYLFLY